MPFVNPMAFIIRRRPRRRELLYIGLGIFLLNLAVSYYYSPKGVWIGNEINSPVEASVVYNTSANKDRSKLEIKINNAKRDHIDAMPISIDVKSYKVRGSRLLIKQY